MSETPPERPVPLLGFDPFRAPRWVQPYLDCVDGIMAQGLGGRWVMVTMHRGGEVVGEARVEVPEDVYQAHRQRMGQGL